MDEIDIKQALSDAEYNFITDLMYQENGIKELFRNKTNRVACSLIPFIITKNGEFIGFIYAADENLKHFGFIDVGIKEAYRGHGYGKKAIEKLVEYFKINYPSAELYLIYETKKENIMANKAINDIGKFLFDNNDLNYYLANKEKFSDLVSSSNYDLLFDHTRKGAMNAGENLRDLMNNDGYQR